MPTDVNGVRVSYCSIELLINGSVRLKAVKAINYKEINNIPKIKGTSTGPIGRPRGDADYEGDLEIYQAEWKALLPLLTRNGSFGFAELSHTLTCSYSERLSPADTVTDTMRGVRFHSPETAQSEGPDVSTVKVQLSIMEIIWANRYRSFRELPG